MQESGTTPSNSPPITHDNLLVSPVSPVSPNSHSILSKLLKNDSERKPLLIKRSKSRDYSSILQQEPDEAEVDNDDDDGTPEDLEWHIPPSHQYDSYQQQQQPVFRPTWKQLKNPKIWMNCFTQPIHYVPAVILGLLLNLLDAISYGMITFPLNNPIFASFGPDGIGMFFVR
jgi:SulP family sulfate permease